MVTLPAATPVTTPVFGSTDAIRGALLLQVPPLFPLAVKLSVAPAHTELPPLIVPAFSTGFTVRVADVNTVPQPEADVTL